MEFRPPPATTGSIATVSNNSEPASLPPTYPIRQWLPDAPNQSIKSSEYGLSAKVCMAAAVPETYTAIAEDLGDHGVPPPRLRRWVDALLHQGPTPEPTSATGEFTLDPYQVEGIRRLSYAGGVLAYGCGLGKTLTAIEYAFSVNSFRRLYIVCPLNAFPAWERHRALMESRFTEVVVLSMDSGHKHQLIDPEPGGVIIFDEVHMLGNMTARRTKAAHKLRLAFDVGICLTGTLLNAGVEKPLSVMNLAVPGASLFSSAWATGRYFKCLQHKVVAGRKKRFLAPPEGEHRERFMTFASRHIVSLTRHTSSVRASVDIPDQELITEFFGEPWESVDQEVATMARAIMIETGEVPHVSAVVHRLARAGLDAKLAWVTDNLDDEPVVFMAAYIDSLDALEAAFTENEKSFVRVDGSVTGRDRAEAMRKFQDGEVQYFIGQQAAASVSMDLFRSAISISIDLSWRPADYEQMLARTCRRGQLRRCLHFDLVANNTQQKILERVQSGREFDSSLAEWQEWRETIQLAAGEVA